MTKKGILRRAKGGGILVEFVSKKGNTVQAAPASGEVSQTILDRLDDFVGKEIEFDAVGGQPKRVREPGGTFVAPTAVEPPRPRRAAVGPESAASAAWSTGSTGGWPEASPSKRPSAGPQRPLPRDFHNPYNFVPSPPRDIDDPDLGDHPPPRQDNFEVGRYTGRIRVRMTAVTPLIVPDADKAREDGNGHVTLPLRVDATGRPAIPASSVRGMLRCAYEAVTNSRFGRFSYQQHRGRLAYRMIPQEGLGLIPARIQGERVVLMTGTSQIGVKGRPRGHAYAAWLLRYGAKGKTAPDAVKYPDESLPQHGDHVVCRLENAGNFWRVVQIFRADDPGVREKLMQRGARSEQWVEGWVCINNANINNKRHERVFFYAGSGAPLTVPLTADLKQAWRDLIENYQSIHRDDLQRRKRKHQRPDEYLGDEPGQTAWSRHIYSESDRELRDGALCYAQVSEGGRRVEMLYPVAISRKLYAVSPWDLLHPTLHPAASLDQLSPADRVFGWVPADADTSARSAQEAVRGLLRVGPVRCDSPPERAVERFGGGGLPLAILSTPKPQQARFYVAQSPRGEAQGDGWSKEKVAYAEGKGLRGRKVYPHQRALPKGHWDNPLEDRTQDAAGKPAHYQEYRRPKLDGREQRDDQNRSILGWVKPGAQFSFDLHVHNLSAVELGALLWLLRLPDDHYHRFGGGKPLGFGSVRLDIEHIDVRLGSDLAGRYTRWADVSRSHDPRQTAIAAFERAVERAYGESGRSFEDVTFIAAFLTACRGHGDELPTHYPRASRDGKPCPPSPAGESFKWFVANERGPKLALRDLVDDPGLPTLRER